MTVQDVSFYSDGLRLDGLLHQRPGGGRAPVLLVCSGLHGLKEWVPAKSPSGNSDGAGLAMIDRFRDGRRIPVTRLNIGSQIDT